jgi:transposase-like protein
MLGTMPDADVAAAVGCATSTVALWRKKFGIPRWKKVYHPPDIEPRHPGMSARLGREPDAVIAAEYGISRERVRQLRAERGIARFDAHPNTLPPDALEILGTVPDLHLADFYDVSVHVVRRAREARGIATVTTDQQYDRIIEMARERVGKVSDRAIANELNIPISQVLSFRQRNGIPPFRLSPRCAEFVPIDRDTIARMFHEGASDDEIAAAVGSTRLMVAHIRSGELGLVRKQGTRRITPETCARVVQMHDAGMSKERIARDLGLSAGSVFGIIRGHRGR